MKKKAKVTVKKPLAPDSMDLRRWCIENAIRWPVDGPYSSNAAAYGHVIPRTEADVIGRAERLLKWVTVV